jgi:P pilus assembly chaperone PapD
MKTVKLLAVALFMGSLSLAQTAAPAAVATPAAPQTPSQLKWEKETHEFGTIEQGKPVSYEFTFTNTTNKDVTLKDVKASCGCTATNYTKTAIKPGEKGTVTATYNAAAGGAFHKTVTVTTSEENAMPKIITIKGTVKVNEAPAVAAPASK